MKYKEYLEAKGLPDTEESKNKYFEEYGNQLHKFIYRDFLERVKLILKDKYDIFLQKRRELGERDLKVLNILGFITFQEQVKLFIEIASYYALEPEDGYNVNFTIKSVEADRIIADEGIITYIPIYTKDKKNYLVSISKFEAIKRDYAAISQESQTITDFKDIVKLALAKNASDLHIKPKDNFYYVFFRINKDFLMMPNLTMPKSQGLQLVRSLKTQASRYTKGSFNPSISSQVQDARISYEDLSTDVRLVFAPMPNLEDEMVVGRLLRERGIQGNLSRLGYLENDIAILQDATSRKGGLFVISGITNSGKSMAIASMLSTVQDKNVLTVEDPVEYQIINKNITQFQIFEAQVEELKSTFVDFAKAFKRADPDIVFVGEWRNEQELSKAIEELAFAGQLVFTTLHINSAFVFYDAVSSIFHVDYESSVRMLILSLNQVLVKSVCPHCAIEMPIKDASRTISDITIRTLPYINKDEFRDFINQDFPIKVRNEAGCPKCGFTGYSGLTPIYEYMYPDVNTKEWIRKDRPSSYEIEDYIRREGLGKNKLDVYMEKLKLGLVDLSPSTINALR